jgi:hypothetical protein
MTGPAQPSQGIFSAAERFFVDLLHAHGRYRGSSTADWRDCVASSRLAGLLEPILLDASTRLIVCDGRPTFGNSCPACGPFRDGQLIAGGAVNPPNAEIEFIPVFEIAFKEGGEPTGPLVGRVLIDPASALFGEVQQAAARQTSAG